MHRLLALIFLLAMAVGAAACGGDSDDLDTTASGSDAPAGSDADGSAGSDPDAGSEPGDPDGSAGSDSGDTDGGDTDDGNTDGGDPPAIEPADGDGALDPDAPIQFGSYPIGELAIEVSNPDGSTLSYTISCLGDTATIIGDGPAGATGDRMCTRLADPEVQDLLINGYPADLVCTEQFGSEHEARITGRLDDQAVDLTVDRFNGCGIFDWDVLFAGVLPAVG